MTPAPVGHHCPTCVGEARAEFRRGAGRRMRIRGLSMTRAIMVVTIAAFIWEVAVAGSSSLVTGPNGPQMINLGAAFPPLIANGQYWRLVTPMFLHYGVIHIAFNMYALYLFGHEVERIYGRISFLLMYVLTGIGGNVASYVFGAVISVGAGASGAVFGMLGAFLAYNYRRRNTAIGAMNVNWVGQIIVLNIFLTLWISAIDWRAHLGGFVTGIAMGALLDGVGPFRQQRVILWAGIAALIAIGVFATIARTDAIRGEFPNLVRILGS
jgi:membrane associated rhomboid family serine protease